MRTDQDRAKSQSVVRWPFLIYLFLIYISTLPSPAFDALLSALGIWKTCLALPPPSAPGILAIVLGWSMPWIALGSDFRYHSPASSIRFPFVNLYLHFLIIVLVAVLARIIVIRISILTFLQPSTSISCAPGEPKYPSPNISMAAVAVMALLMACGATAWVNISSQWSPRGADGAPSLSAR